MNSKDADAVEAILGLTGGRGVEVAIDCSGNPAGQNTALDAAGKLGCVAFVGESRATQINPSDQVIRKLLTVVGGWYFPLGEWQEILRFVDELSTAEIAGVLGRSEGAVRVLIHRALRTVARDLDGERR